MCVFGGLLLGAAAAAAVPGEFSFAWDAGRCRLEADDARVVDILAEMSKTTGVPIQYDKNDVSTITLSITDMNFEQVIRAVAGNVVLTYAVDPESPDGYRVQRVRVDAAADERTRSLVESQQVIANTAPIPETGRVKYSGIGASIRYAEDRQGVHLNPLTPESPIADSGITPEDVIVAVDGHPVASYGSISDMTKTIRGPAGTPVTFTVRRTNGTTADIVVIRQVVEFTRPGGR